jgi:hypothetical protein
MTPSPAGKALIAHEESVKAAKAAMDYFLKRRPKNPTVGYFLKECREIYELCKIQHHEGRVTWEHLEKIRRQLEKLESLTAKRKAQP